MMDTITNIRKMWKHDFIIESQNFCHTLAKKLKHKYKHKCKYKNKHKQNLTKTGQLFTRPFASGYLTESNIYCIGLI